MSIQKLEKGNIDLNRVTAGWLIKLFLFPLEIEYLHRILLGWNIGLTLFGSIYDISVYPVQPWLSIMFCSFPEKLRTKNDPLFWVSLET